MPNQERASQKPSFNYAVAAKRPSLKPAVRSAIDRQGIKVLYDQDTSRKSYFIKHIKVYYEGEWKNSLPNGRGFAIYPDGSYLEGNFEQGQVEDARGLLLLSNGAVYRGNIQNSVISGDGVMTHGEYSYEGRWVNGRPHGRGIEKYGELRSYDGDFKNGVKHGRGIYTDEQLREQYRGQFQDGFMNGVGEYRVEGRVVYSGQFEKGKKVGQGILTTQNGKLKGYFKDDVVSGQGSFQWNDGRVYRGGFLNSKFHGEGRIILMNGNVLIGTWTQGHSDKLTLLPNEG